MEWVIQKPAVPPSEGWYRVMHPGDCETDGPYVFYDYPDYEAWAYWTPATPDEFEDFDGGWKGGWTCEHDEEGEFIVAYCGPFAVPPFPKEALK